MRGQRRSRGRVGGQRRQAEPAEHGLAGRRDEEVVQPNVSVHGVALVRGGERARDDHADPQGVRDRQRTCFAHPVGERATFKEVGNDVGPAVLGQTPGVYGRDVRVPRQAVRAGTSLFEPPQRLVVGHRSGQSLDRYRAVEPQVVRPVQLPARLAV